MGMECRTPFYNICSRFGTFLPRATIVLCPFSCLDLRLLSVVEFVGKRRRERLEMRFVFPVDDYHVDASEMYALMPSFLHGEKHSMQKTLKSYRFPEKCDREKKPCSSSNTCIPSVSKLNV